MATKIRQSNLDNSIVTGLDTLNAGAATTDQVIVYDASAGTLKKISQTNFLNFPSITSVSPTNLLSGDGTGNYTIIINGTGFTGASANLLNSSGAAVAFDSVTVNSDIKITGVIAKSSMPGSGEPYDVKVTAPPPPPRPVGALAPPPPPPPPITNTSTSVKPAGTVNVPVDVNV